MAETLVSVLAAALPDSDIADVHDTGPAWNDLSETVRVDTVSADIRYVGYATDGHSTRIRPEGDVVRYLGESGRVHDAGTDRPERRPGVRQRERGWFGVGARG